MKTAKFLLAVSLALAATPFVTAMTPVVVEDTLAEHNTLTWLQGYYKNPQPELLVRRVHVLSSMGYFEQEGQPAQAIGFFATVFAQNPDKIDYWFKQFAYLPARHQRLMAAALWQSGDSRAQAVIARLAPAGETSAARALLASQPTPLTQTLVASESTMNLQWGAYLASGDERHVTAILAAIGTKAPGIADSARLSLALNAAQDDRVLAICRAQLDKQPNAVREVLRAAINEAEVNKAPAS